MHKDKIRVALLGGGVVGGGVIRLVRENAEHLGARIGAPIEIAHVLVRDRSKARVPECEEHWVTTDPEVVFSDESVDVVVEVMGGQEPASGYLRRAIAAGKSVVTANKLLVAHQGGELLRQAAANSVDLAFEASVGGGVPIIRTLRDSLTSDWVDSVYALLNGTCNYVLTRMQHEGLGFEEVVRDAQRLGYAEADPSLDVDGHDAAQKLVVLSMLAFGADVDPERVHVEGIRQVDAQDFAFAERYGFTIKHLAVGRPCGERLELRVHPALVPKEGQLAGINGVLNGALIQGRALGPCLLVGRGAGEMPTAVSVVADVVDVARARVEGATGLLSSAIRPEPCALVPMSELECRYYLRFSVADELGVLGKIATTLGECGVSVEHVVQDSGSAGESPVALQMITHLCKEGHVSAALHKLAEASFMSAPPRLIRIEAV